MSENHHEVREIDADIVGKHGLGMDVARAGKDRSARVNHHGHTIGLRSFVNSGERPEPIAIGVGRKNLVRGMDFQPADPEFRKAVHFGCGIGNVFRMHRAKSDQPFRRCGAIARNPVIHFGRKADYFRADIINQAGALDADGVQKFQKSFGVGYEALDIGIIAAAALDQFERLRLEHVQRLDVDVDINDRNHVALIRRRRNRQVIARVPSLLEGAARKQA